jgi:hypothetical protein
MGRTCAPIVARHIGKLCPMRAAMLADVDFGQ